MIDRANRLPRLCAVIASCVLLFACGAGDPDKQLASAKAYLDKGDARSAVIELKTVLQQQPDRAEARYLLGKALLEGEDAIAATVELRKALDLKHSAVEVDPLLAQALLAQGKASDVVARYGAARLDDKAAQASLMTTVALAYAQLGQLAKAEATLKQVGESMPTHVPAQVALARLAAAKGDRDAALKTIEAVAASGGASADAWALQGDLLSLEPRQRADALAAYRKALSVDPRHVASHTGVVRLLLAASDLDGAGAALADMRKVRPGHPVAAFLGAQLAYEKRDYKSAREGVQQLLKSAPDHPLLNHLAGAIEMAGGSPALARSHLSKTVQAVPTNAPARRMLAGALLRSGEHDKAVEVLEPLLSSSAPDAAALALAGEAQMQAGNLDAAAQLLARAGKAQPDDPLTQTALARTKFLKGDQMGAVADLERVAATDKGTAADLELINAQLRRGDARAALKAIDGLERKMPGKPLPSHLRGVAYLQLKDGEQARASFERAIGADASFLPAVLSLVATDLAAGKPQDAQARLDDYLKRHPGHGRALVALAEVKARQNAPAQEVGDVLTKAVQANPTEAALRVRLIEHHLLHKNVDVALTTAQQADSALPDQPTILDALGRAQFAAGQQNQAMLTFNKILSVQPKNTAAHLRIADANVATKNKDAAIQSLKRAITAQPNAPVLYQRLFVLQVQTGRTAEALQLARDLQKRQPQHSLGWILEGDALRVQKNNDAALVAYRTGSGKAAPTDAAVRYHALLIATGKRTEADRFDAAWAKDRPGDLIFALYRADAALGRRELQQAEALYQRVLEIQPHNVPALNNLAWVTVKLGKPGALALAERANRLMPNQASVMDTLAMAMAADNRIDAAIELQKKAMALQPANDALRLGMARLYVQAGRKAEAKGLLEPLALLGDKFREQDEVKTLLARL